MHNHEDEHEKLVKTTVFLEEEAVEALDELKEEFTARTGKRWSRGAVVRVAVAEFFSRRGKII
jgi:hypothetical protein